MRLAHITDRAAELSEKYQVPEHLNQASRKLSEVSEKVVDRVSVASDAARRGAAMAYRTALEHPKTSIGAVIMAAALVGGALWYVFGNWRSPRIQRRRSGTRVRAGTERRRKHRAAAGREMIRFILTVALVGGLLNHVFGQNSRPRKPAVKSARRRKPARRPAQRAAA